MKIAIIGAGFAGLATAWNLLNSYKKKIDVTIFDPFGVGGKVSRIAAGLLHPFSGLHAKLNRFGFEGYHETLELLEVSKKALNKEVYENSGILRLALTQSQLLDYKKCAERENHVQFLSALECEKKIPYIEPYPGIYIENAKAVYSESYLEGLFLACQNLGGKLVSTKVNQLQELDSFDLVIVTAGADTTFFSELKDLPISFVKGQVLHLEWPKDLTPLPFPLNSQGYLLMSQDRLSCIAGATFERNFENPYPDLKKAKDEILPKIECLIPKFRDAKIIECKAGVRVSTKDHMPLIKKIRDNLYVFVGLGSKGLLYHALYAKKLSQLIMKEKGI